MSAKQLQFRTILKFISTLPGPRTPQHPSQFLPPPHLPLPAHLLILPLHLPRRLAPVQPAPQQLLQYPLHIPLLLLSRQRGDYNRGFRHAADQGFREGGGHFNCEGETRAGLAGVGRARGVRDGALEHG